MEQYTRGGFTLEQVETRLAQDISLGLSQADSLLEELNAFNAANDLAQPVYDTLRERIWSSETERRTRLAQTSNADSDADGPVVMPPLPEAMLAQQDSASDVTTLKPMIGEGAELNGRFKLEEQIGRGGMSRVFRAVDQRKVEAKNRNPYVAVKIMKVEGPHAGQAFIAMQREVDKARALHHPNILEVFDFDRDGDVVFTTMELLTGQPLQQAIADAQPGVVPAETANRIVRETALALQFAHERSVVHADLKPSNIFLTDAGAVKVIDFGIARAIQDPDVPEENRTVFDPRAMGALTPAYASPEMLENKDTDPRDDIYGFGCVIYELLSGRHPFAGIEATQARELGTTPRRIDGLPEHQWQVLERSLSFSRGQRTRSAAEILEAFSTDSAPVPAPPPVPQDVPTELAAPRPASAATESSAQPPGHGSRWLLGAVALAAVAVAAWALWPASEPAPHTASNTASTGAPATSQEPTPTAAASCTLCPAVITVPSGTTRVGLPKDNRPGMFEYPQRAVSFASSFAIGAREVTVGEFARYAQAMGEPAPGCYLAAPSGNFDAAASWREPGFAQTDQHPVTCVSYEDATGYAQWLSAETGARYRLPTEAEWEYAARTAAKVSQEPGARCQNENTADETLRAQGISLDTAACNDGHAYSAPVDRNTDSPIADMRGNVYEWTQDCWSPSYQQLPVDGTANSSGNCSARVLRGGSWFTAPAQQRLTYRNHFPMDHRSNTFGIRIAKETSSQ